MAQLARLGVLVPLSLGVLQGVQARFDAAMCLQEWPESDLYVPVVGIGYTPRSYGSHLLAAPLLPLGSPQWDLDPPATPVNATTLAFYQGTGELMGIQRELEDM